MLKRALLVIVPVLMLTARPAQATPIDIGLASWNLDPFDSTASTFAVESFNIFDFLDVHVFFQLTGGSLDLSLGDIPMNSSAQTLDFLSTADILSATVTLALPASANGSLFLASPTFLSAANGGTDGPGSVRSIQFIANSVTPARAPEPASLLLVATGVGTLAARVRRRRVTRSS